MRAIMRKVQQRNTPDSLFFHVMEAVSRKRFAELETMHEIYAFVYLGNLLNFHL